MTEFDQDILDAFNTELALDGLEDQPMSILQDDLPPIYPVYFRFVQKEEDMVSDEQSGWQHKEFECFHDAWLWINKHKKDIFACSNPTIYYDRLGAPTPERRERIVRYAKILIGG